MVGGLRSSRERKCCTSEVGETWVVSSFWGLPLLGEPSAWLVFFVGGLHPVRRRAAALEEELKRVSPRAFFRNLARVSCVLKALVSLSFPQIAYVRPTLAGVVTSYGR